MSNQSIKVQFHEVILNKIVCKKNWADELSKVLHVSTDTIYKKARMDSFYSLDEVIILMKHFGISLDEMVFDRSDHVHFKMPQLTRPVKNIEEYLGQLANTFQMVQQAKNVKLYYATRELPIFYYFLNDTLAAFKLFVFGRTVWNISRMADACYSKDLFDPEIFQLTKNIWNHYAQYNSEEYWNNNVMDNTIQQLLYYFDCGVITTCDAISIIEALKEVTSRCKKMAITNSKNLLYNQNNYKLYNNKIMHTSNHVRVSSDDFNVLYLTYDSPNFIISENSALLHYTDQWYNSIQENSYYLGKGSGHHALDFFNSIIEKITAVEKRILNYSTLM